MPDERRAALASTSLSRHLARGAIGFGLMGAALALTPSAGPAALLIVLPGMVALRGCPTCWVAGLLQTVSAGRMRRVCTDTSCKLEVVPTVVRHEVVPSRVPRGRSSRTASVSRSSRSRLT
jgi:hypothetical protein